MSAVRAKPHHSLIGLLLAGGAAFAYFGVVIAAYADDPNTIEFVTYFDEAVEGLELGSPVQVRGADFGKVTRIQAAPDLRLVEVHCELYKARLSEEDLQIAGRYGQVEPAESPVRVMLSSVGLTGQTVVLLDFVDDPSEHPPLELGFENPYIGKYIPATKSFSAIFRDWPTALHQVPARLEQFEQGLARVEQFLDDQDVVNRSQQILAALDEAQTKLAAVDIAQLDSEAHANLSSSRESLDGLREVCQRLLSEEGGLAQLQDDLGTALDRVEEPLEQLGEGGQLMAETRAALADLTLLARSLAVDVQEALQATRDLRPTLNALKDALDHLDRDPGALLYGEVGGRSRPPPGTENDGRESPDPDPRD